VAGVRAVQPTPEATKPPFVPVIPPPTVTPAPTPALEPGEEAPTFVLGFAFLKQQLGATMGVPLENEHGETATCDTQQRTTTGLAYWRCSTNTMTFAALPDGLVHWAWLGQLVTWTGPSPDAPADATVVINPTALGDDLNAEACRPAPDGSLTCRIRDGSTSTGFIQASGQTDTYMFTVASPTIHVTADLTDLPADYDLYLADAGGAVLSTSAREGTLPEQVDLDLGPGTYYLFVHSDPGRTFDPAHPYHLHLAMAPPLPPNAASAPVEAP
jgi:hypothetical protein